MTVTLAASGSATRIRLEGDFDFSAQEVLKQAVEQAVNSPARRIEVDMEQTTFIDSSVIRLFLKLSDAAKKNQKTLSIVNCNERIREIFVIGGFDQIFEIN